MNEQQYAGFWVRASAAVIDLIILCTIIIILLLLVDVLTHWIDIELNNPPPKEVQDVVSDVLYSVVSMAFFLLFWDRYAATPGKMMLGLRIVDAKTGEKMGIGQQVVRYFAYTPALLFLGMGLLWVGFDKRKQGWHDKLAGTVVVRKNIA